MRPAHVLTAKHEDKTEQDSQDPPHKPQGNGPQGPPDPDTGNRH
ncbi:hypothetical protein [Saccharopolyspora phatthalungensis]|uniref:Uncharacterized protein n=1 Tax=Saccharopolyspora phatthalungensis TaxID=664693 RepID=A0A840QJ68_9PSEU|nr:hypothetical protein [Saccharopolyspora phatthalungensis]MBB5158825.1 hypothetical protein [Saccharopolyspora phatthalungensis]